MPSFRHTPDDMIFFDNDVMPLSFFLTQEADYSLPSDAITREYVQGSHHVLSDGSTQYAGEYPYSDGDLYISKKAFYFFNYAEHLTAIAEQKHDKS